MVVIKLANLVIDISPQFVTFKSLRCTCDKSQIAVAAAEDAHA